MSNSNPYAAPETEGNSSSTAASPQAPAHPARLAAYVVDAFISVFFGTIALMAAMFGSMAIVEARVADPELRDVARILTLVLSMAVLFLAWPVIETLCVASPLGESVGHRLFAMQVVMADGRPCPLGRRFLRSLVKLIVLWLFYFLAVTVMFDSDRRAPWDFIFGTRVVRRTV